LDHADNLFSKRLFVSVCGIFVFLKMHSYQFLQAAITR
jgi:hypothetical protein